MTKYLLFICLSLNLLVMSSAAQMTVAIADFNNQSGQFYLDEWESAVPEYLQGALSGSERITLLERRELNAVLKEHALGMTGLLDSSKAQEVGGLLGAQYIVSGAIDQTGDQIRINAKIIKVATGEMKSESVHATNRQNFDEMMVLLGNNILHTLAGERTYREKIELKKYPTTYFLIATAGLAAGTFWANNAYHQELDTYNNTTSLDQFDTSYDSANKLYKTRNVMLALTGAALVGTIYCWIQNLNPDVIAAGRQSEPLSFVPEIIFDTKGKLGAKITLYF